MSISEVFEAAEAAKRQGHYPAANAAFAVLVNHFLLDLTVELETMDWNGEHPDELHYDLFVLRHEDGYMCIPAPLLASWTVLLLMKRAKIVQRPEHNRQAAPISEHVPTSKLWDQLVQASGLSREVIDEAYDITIIPAD